MYIPSICALFSLYLSSVIETQKRVSGKVLIDLVNSRIDLQETDYFGLQYVDSTDRLVRSPDFLLCYSAPCVCVCVCGVCVCVCVCVCGVCVCVCVCVLLCLT